MEAQELADGEFPVLRRFLVRGANPITAINANIPRFGDAHPGKPGWLAVHYRSESMGRDAAVVNVTYSRAPVPIGNMPMDELKRVTAMRNMGIISRDEARAEEGFPPLFPKPRAFRYTRPCNWPTASVASTTAAGPREYKSYTLAPRVPWLRVAILSGLASAAVLYAMRLNGWL